MAPFNLISHRFLLRRQANFPSTAASFRCFRFVRTVLPPIRLLPTFSPERSSALLLTNEDDFEVDQLDSDEDDLKQLQAPVAGTGVTEMVRSDETMGEAGEEAKAGELATAVRLKSALFSLFSLSFFTASPSLFRESTD